MQPIVTAMLLFLSGINPGQAQTRMEALQGPLSGAVSGIPQARPDRISGAFSAQDTDFCLTDRQPLSFIVKNEISPNGKSTDGQKRSEERAETADSLLVSNQESVVIYFPFGDATVLPTYKYNKESFERLDALFRDRVPVPGDTVILVGKASMDGPEPFNAALAQRRADALRSYFVQRYPYFNGILTVRVDGEAWADLRAEVAADSLLAADTRSAILGIIDSDASADRKEADLKAVSGWNNYARSLYPTFRNATVTSIYTAPFVPDEAEFAWGIPEEDWNIPAITLLPDFLSVPSLSRRALRPVLGVSTNLIYDITYVPGYGLTSIPSLSLEYYPARTRHFTYGLDVEWPMWEHWDTHRFLQINNISLWARRYFPAREDRFRGLYLQAGANAARFGIGWDARGWQGEGIGASVGLGHKWLLGKSRLFLDCGVALGAFLAQYDPYVYGNDATHRYYYDYTGDPAQFHKRNQRFFWAGPTRVYISLGIDLFNRKRR